MKVKDEVGRRKRKDDRKRKLKKLETDNIKKVERYKKATRELKKREIEMER